MTLAERRSNFQRTRRDARVAVAGWLLTLAWVVGASWWFGTERPAALWFGIPKWVVLGVAIPWVVTLVFNTWFSMTLLAEADSPAGSSMNKGKSARQ